LTPVTLRTGIARDELSGELAPSVQLVTPPTRPPAGETVVIVGVTNVRAILASPATMGLLVGNAILLGGDLASVGERSIISLASARKRNIDHLLGRDDWGG
jgi:hypothetical protein